MTARNKLLGFLSKNTDMLTPQQAARVEAMSKVAGPVGALGVDALLAAVVQWSEARKMRCLSCDEGQESAPCTCFDGVAAIDAAEKKLQEIADEAANNRDEPMATARTEPRKTEKT